MFSVTTINGQPNSSKTKDFTVDLESDIAKLPTRLKLGIQINPNDTVSNDYTSVGSTAFVIETSSVYMLGNDDIWHKL